MDMLHMDDMATQFAEDVENLTKRMEGVFQIVTRNTVKEVEADLEAVETRISTVYLDGIEQIESYLSELDIQHENDKS